MNSKEFIFFNILFFSIIFIGYLHPEELSLSLRIGSAFWISLLWILKGSERFKILQSKWVKHLCSLLLIGTIFVSLYNVFFV